MTLFPKGGPLLYAQPRPRMRSVFFIFLLMALVLAACGQAVGGNNNWPGLSTDNQNVYITAGPIIYALDVASEELLWTYPPEAGRAGFFCFPGYCRRSHDLGGFWGVWGHVFL